MNRRGTISSATCDPRGKVTWLSRRRQTFSRPPENLFVVVGGGVATSVAGEHALLVIYRVRYAS